MEIRPSRELLVRESDSFGQPLTSRFESPNMWKFLATASLSVFVCGFIQAHTICSFAQEFEFYDSIKEARDSAEQEKPVVLFFEAAWCGPCQQMLANVFPNLDAETANAYLWVRVNIDSQPELAKEYTVRAIPATIIIDVNNIEVARQLGGGSADRLMQFLKLFDQLSRCLTTESEEELYSVVEEIVQCYMHSKDETKEQLVNSLKNTDPRIYFSLLALLHAEELEMRKHAFEVLNAIIRIELTFNADAEIEDRSTQIEGISAIFEKMELAAKNDKDN